MGDSFGWFNWNAGLLVAWDLFGAKSMPINAVDSFWMAVKDWEVSPGSVLLAAPILRALKAALLCRPWIKSLEIPEFGK